MNPTQIELLGTVIFAIAVLHTFVAGKFQAMAHHYPEGSIQENLFHFLGEVEAIFGMWAAIFIGGYAVIDNYATYDDSHHLVGGALHYLEGINFTEPGFVFVIMCMAGTRPIILLAEKLIGFLAKLLPFNTKMSFYVAALVLGPLLGSFITEPAAMTVTALILLDYFYSGKMSKKFKYATLGLLFVNVSIGGTLTHFAAPPVLMVAGKWHWGMEHMVLNFGYKAAICVLVATLMTAFAFKSELQGELVVKAKHDNYMLPTWWITLIHLIFMAGVVANAHHMVFFMGLFLFFLGFMKVTSEYQDTPKILESLLVGFFLGGLVTLGGVQAWWIAPLLKSMGELALP